MRNFVYLMLVFLVVCSMVQSQTVNKEDRIEALEKICKQQEEQITRLQKRLGILENDESYKEYTQKIVKEYLKEPHAEEPTGVVAGYDKGFFVKSADGNYELKITGLIQVGLGIFENGSLDNNSFYPAGVYVNFDAYLMKKVHASIQVDFASTGFAGQFRGGQGNPAITEAIVEYLAMPEFNLRVGNTHVPFTIAGQYAPNQGVMIWSEPFIASWSIGRDPGIMIYGLISDMLEYKLSFHNGNGSMATNNDDNMLFAGSLRAYFLGQAKNPNSFFHIGFMRSRNMRQTNGDDDDHASAVLYSPWGRKLFENDSDANKTNDADTRGWKTGFDIGLRFDKDLENGSNFRVETEFMYQMWERMLDGNNRLPFLIGYGWSFAASYRHCLDKEVKGSGIVPAFAFSYTNIDNKETDTATGEIGGVGVINTTLGLGYAFNEHLFVNFNWVIMDIKGILDTNPAKEGGKYDDGPEYAWFLQFTAAW